MAAANWCTIESDPGVFTELIGAMGVKNVQVEECYDLDSIRELEPVYGLVFLFKWQKEDGPPRTVVEEPVPGLFFANQVINNACATQAIISVLLNRPELELGDVLKNFKEFTSAFLPDIRGMALTNSEEIRKAHNSFARPEPFVVEEKKSATSEEDAFHFITYTPFNGKLYELDGLQRGPILLGDCTTENWLDVVKPHIQERISKYSQSEIRFNLMGIIRNRKQRFLEDIEKLEKKKEGFETQLAGGEPPMTDLPSPPTTPEELRQTIADIDHEIAAAREHIREEEEKFARWKVENIRRKHNYIPFVFNLLKTLAAKGELMPLVDKAMEKNKPAEKAAEETQKAKEGEAEKPAEKDKQPEKDTK